MALFCWIVLTRQLLLTIFYRLNTQQAAFCQSITRVRLFELVGYREYPNVETRRMVKLITLQYQA